MRRRRCLTDQEIAAYHGARAMIDVFGNVILGLAKELPTAIEIEGVADALVQAADKVRKLKKGKP